MKPRSLAAALALVTMLPLAASAAVSISVEIAPPALPVYVQPVIPAAGYLWTPGYWRWSAGTGDYFWVPGTWVAPPYVGALWTPGWWGWGGGGGYVWHGGYWGNHVGFYGGINYGFGYVGHGYQGGYWNGGAFNYNRSVNNVNTTIVRNVYNTTVVNNNVTRTSFNGGQGGIADRPSREEQQARAEQHVPPTPTQKQHEQVALRTPEQRASLNHGTPALAASARAGEMHGAPLHADRGHPGEAADRGDRAPERLAERAPERPQEHAQEHGQERARAQPPERHADRGQPNRGEHREGREGREH